MDQKLLSPSTSPSSSSSTSSSTSSSSNNNNNGGGAAPAAAAAAAETLPPLTPKSIPNPNQNSNPYPTTFIQADTQSFKQVVQMLTGSAETAAKRNANTAAAQITPAANSNPHFTPAPPKNPIPPISKANKKPAFKLYERRSSMKNLKMITTLNSAGGGGAAAAFSPRKQPEILSPSVLDFPSLVLSPVTPLSPDPFNRSPHTPSISMLGLTSAAEDRAIAEKGFYLHPSPRLTTPRDAEPPKLLPLFPLTSPRMESSSN